ncbi:hypothetical protein QBC38DRAFT_465615 [Podospora fimiseda]|uniref:Uncharacterized protein n=1 Tax=Podospora fimiseda TaxID=252190 RepID=A0AAN7BZI2_9PEZI|nr:hypothetical protein QBC38DRAFT_465615 [Podospora fimiseda]
MSTFSIIFFLSSCISRAVYIHKFIHSIRPHFSHGDRISILLTNYTIKHNMAFSAPLSHILELSPFFFSSYSF